MSTAAPSLQYEVTKKMLAKRDANVEMQILSWIGQVLGEKVPTGPYEDVLSDGTLLCRVMNKLKPGSIPKINESGSTHFKLVENLSNFLRQAQKFGVEEHDLFQTTDLIDKRNIPAVTNCILAVGRAVCTERCKNVYRLVIVIFLSQCYLHPEYKGPYLGPKPAEQNIREFTDDQINASKSMATWSR
ncbi:muscle-specific protein 20-like protein [Dinothrombium tinctorium]|uniref:Muscle-specific protein 20-like protein n=1 Tax=Dinothrombium tinctorium TaxID=1965070 RepID=A0A3S3P9R1_9ACAR|nr:muscle-specific protein 20-like protein [Dinothrombium tinctorium]